MRPVLLSLGIMAMSVQTVSALRLDVEPGSLVDNIAALKYTNEKELVLSGSADVTDLVLLHDMSDAVKTLDMSALHIVAYTYTDGNYMGRKSFEAGEIPPYMLMGSKVETVKFPASVRIVGESAFAASNLIGVDLPATVERVGDYAFSNCRKLDVVTVLEPVTFGRGVFKDCCSLQTVSFGYAIAEIPEAMFEGCGEYSAALPESVTKVGGYAFHRAGLESVDMRTLKEIGDFAFAEMPYLKEVIFEMGNTVNVGKGAFYNSLAITELPNWEGVLPELVLSSTTGGKNLSVAYSEIGEAAFANNQTVEYLTLTRAVKSVAPHAFRNMKSLKQVNVTELGTEMPDVDPLSFSGLENSEGRYDIILNVEKDTNDTWAKHPVWGLFDIKNMHTIVGSVAQNSVDINVRRDSDVLTVTSSSPIDFVGIYTLGGIKLSESSPDTESWQMSGIDPAAIVVVKVRSMGVTKVLKLN